MGQAQSNNYTNTVIDSYARVVQSTTNTAINNSLNEVRIGIEGGTGNVNISNVLSKQTIESDLVASFKQANDSAIVQKVAQELQQQASSLVSGVNFGSYAESNNTINTAISASMDVSQTISTTCASTAANVFNVEVAGREGDINIDKLDLTQSIKNSVQCAAESLNKSVAQQDVSNKIAQTATATAEGLTLNFMMMFLPFAFMVGVVSYAARPLLIPMLILWIFASVEYGIYTFGLKVVQDKIKLIQKVIADNKKKQKKANVKKMPEQIFSVSYTGGLNGLTQGSSGCTYTKVDVPATFTSPESAYDYWLTKPEYKAIDILSRGNGTHEYHFYSKVSEDCTTALKNAPKTIPSIICVVADPVDGLNNAPANADENTFVFSRLGFAYCKINGSWVALNTNSAFTAATKDNLKVFMTPSPSETGEEEVEFNSAISGTFYYIDASTARAAAGTSTTNVDSFYFTIDSFDIGSTPVKKAKLSKANYKTTTEIDITQLVKGKGIGPFMPNPKLAERNYTAIWEEKEPTAEEQNAQMLADEKKKEQTYQNAMIGVGVVGLVVLSVGGVAAMRKA